MPFCLSSAGRKAVFRPGHPKRAKCLFCILLFSVFCFGDSFRYAFSACGSAFGCAASFGRVTVNTVPSPGLLVSETVP